MQAKADTVTRFFAPRASTGMFHKAVVHCVRGSDDRLTLCGLRFRLGETRSSRWAQHWNDRSPTCATCRRAVGLDPLPASYRHEDY